MATTKPAVAIEARSLSLGAIFNFREHWHKLLERPAFHAPVLDGIRAIAVLWVVLYHSVYFHNTIFPTEVETIFRNPMTSFVARGDLGVDLFFVLSGFLMGAILFKEHQKTGRIRFSRFYARRFLRLIPVYCIAMLLGLFLLAGVNAENLWANLLYVNNFLPIGQQYMGWCWSLAIEEQFYLVLPAVLVLFFGLGKGRLRVLVALLALLGLVQFAVFQAHGFVRFEPGVTDGNRWFDVTYDKPWMRSGELLSGVIGAFLTCYRRAALERFFTRLWLVRAIFVSYFAVKLIMRFALSHLPVWAMTLWTSHQSDQFAAMVMFIILAATYSKDTVWAWLRSVLSWKGFYPMAQLSYSVYLVHEMFVIWMFPKTAPLLVNHFGATGTIVLDSLLAFAVVLCIASALYVTVEKPCMEMRALPAIRDLGQPANN